MEGKYYLLFNGALRKIDLDSGEWENVSEDKFFQEYTPGHDRVIKQLSGNDNDKTSGELLQKIKSRYSMNLTEDDQSFLKSCNKLKEEKPTTDNIPEKFDSDEVYCQFLDQHINEQEIRLEAYRRYKAGRK